jgi:hypothetical protein
MRWEKSWKFMAYLDYHNGLSANGSKCDNRQDWSFVHSEGKVALMVGSGRRGYFWKRFLIAFSKEKDGHKSVRQADGGKRNKYGPELSIYRRLTSQRAEAKLWYQHNAAYRQGRCTWDLWGRRPNRQWGIFAKKASRLGGLQASVWIGPYRTYRRKTQSVS